MLEQLSGLALVLSSWSALAALLVGVGRSLRRVAGWDSTDPLGDLWIGYAGVVGALQVWHLVGPVNLAAFAAFGLVGLGGLIQDRGATLRRLWTWLRGPRLAVFSLLCVALAHCAAGPPTLYDTGLYHLTAVRWLREGPIVPGLGNLHGRLAFNNASFLWCALVDAGPWGRLSIHVAQGVLFLPLLVRASRGADRVLSARRARFSHLFWILVAAMPFHPLVGAPAAFTPDHVVALISLELLARIEAVVRGGAPHDRRMVLLLAALSVVVKLSAAVLAGSCVLLLLATAGARGRAWRETPLALVLALGLLVPWTARGVVLSGCPAYPSSLGRLALDWSVSEAQAAQEALSVRSWARASKVDPAVVAGWDWVLPWARGTLPRSDVWPPFVMLVVTSLGCLRAGARPERSVAPPVLALVSWFVLAPDPRFAHGLLWGLPALVMAQKACSARSAPWIRKGLVFASMVLVARFCSQSTSLDMTPFQPFPRPAVREQVTASGLRVHVPITGFQCWDAPLPCAPSAAPGLRLRRPGELFGGFTRATGDR